MQIVENQQYVNIAYQLIFRAAKYTCKPEMVGNVK